MYFEKFRYEVEGIRIYRKDSKKSWTNLLLVLAAALLVKLIFAAAYEGHGTDMTCFSAWSDMIFKDGFWNFYHSDSFTDYPPGYMAMLWGIGALRSIFNLDVFQSQCFQIQLYITGNPVLVQGHCFIR